jgi:hypothetical protein
MKKIVPEGTGQCIALTIKFLKKPIIIKSNSQQKQNVVMKKCKRVFRTILAAVLVISTLTGVTAQEKDSVLTVAVIKTIHSTILGEDRKIFIQTPGENDRR